MNRRLFLTAMLGTPALAALVAACGDNSVGSPGDTTNGSTPLTFAPGNSAPGTSDGTTSGAMKYPTGADDVVVRIAYEGGFVAPATLFSRLPTLLISGDGRAFTPGVQTEQFPGPLVAPVEQRSIDPLGMQRVLMAAVDAGLLAPPPDYSLPGGVNIADAADTVVVIAANGGTFTHRAYALDITDVGTTPARTALATFVAQMSDLATAAGAGNIGAEGPYVPSAYRVQAMATDPSQVTDPSPTVVDWPAGTGVALATATVCASVPATAVGSLFAAANQRTFFRDAGVAYALAVTPVLPGDTSC